MLITLLACLLALTAAADPLADYVKRRTQLAGNLAQEHFALAEWCNKQKLYPQAREHYRQTLSLNPSHTEARDRLVELNRLTRRSGLSTCEFVLRNGTKVKADMLAQDLTLDTSAGVLLIPVSEIDLIEIAEAPAPDRIISDHYTGEGRVRAELFPAKGKVGNITVKRADVVRIRVLRPCATCDGQGRMTCLRCGGTGQLKGKSVCPTCKGKGAVKCKRCGGKGKIVCPLCGGAGTFTGAWRRMRRVRCPRCRGEGTIDCPDCNGTGRVVCPTCNGKPVTRHDGPCPVCNGKGTLECKDCAGTGVKPLPRPPTDEIAAPEDATEPPPPGPPENQP
jgi:hypothetical protein